MSVRGVVFDLDNTLIETNESALAALDVTCDHLEARLGTAVAAARDTFLCVYIDLENALIERRRQFESAYQVRVETWRQTLAHLGQPASLAEEMVEYYAAERRRRFRLYPEVPAVLDAVTAAWPGAILTNGFTDVQREKIAAVGLGRWLPTAIISAEVGAWKPQPEAFAVALRAIGCRPEEAVMVGDSWKHDIAGAAPLGLRTVWVNRRGAPPPRGPEPSAAVADLSPLDQLLRHWNGE
ncbi:MAG: HAD family hydrolase [Armatimonadetes bacterium]|nr:HAD family hydrolase [Armatimonadota bacterium]